MSFKRSEQKAKSRLGVGRPDYLLSIATFFLVAFGVVIISSASAVISRNDTGDANYYFKSQLVSIAIGIVLFLITYNTDYRFWKKLALPMLVITLILIVAVFIPGVGVYRNGAYRWLNIFGYSFQPSELAKLAIIIYLATLFESKGIEVKRFLSSFIPFVIILGSVLLVVAYGQKDLGTAVIIAFVAATIYFIAGAKIIHVIIMISIGVGFGVYMIKNAAYRMQRFMIFLNPESDSGGTGYHINQALMAVGSGGILGLGFGKSRQKFSYLPEASTDSIFAIIAEELGLVGALALVVLFLVFGIKGYQVSRNAPDVFSRLVAVGITTWVVGQAFINIMVILSLLPMTGVPLPFISSGGSSIIMLLAGCGILLNISKHSQKGVEVASSRFGRWNWRAYFPGFSRR